MMVVVEVELSTLASCPEEAEGGPAGWEGLYPSLAGSLAFHLW